MKFDILTIFPDQIEAVISEGVFRIAESKNLVTFKVHDLRKWTSDAHKTVDDRPFGGGAGMVMKVEPIFKALQELRAPNSKVIVMTPRGDRFTQQKAKEMASTAESHYIFICGHYEGLDERIHEHLADEEISIGDYILSGGELPALVVIDSVTRLIPGVLGNENSLIEESFEGDTLEYPQYTRPEEFNGWKVPEILLSGNHDVIKKWRKDNSSKV